MLARRSAGFYFGASLFSTPIVPKQNSALRPGLLPGGGRRYPPRWNAGLEDAQTGTAVSRFEAYAQPGDYGGVGC